MKKTITTLIVLLSSFNIFSQDIPGIKEISLDNLKATVAELASDKYDGRLPASKGYFKAADYIEDQIKTIGLKPLLKKTYFQNVPVEYNLIKGTPEFSILMPLKNAKPIVYQLGKDFVCRSMTGSGNITANIVFCGYGISKPEWGYDDYASIDVKGKIVLMFKQNPSWNTEKSNNWEKLYPRYKANVAASKGALGVIFISKPLDKNPQKPIGSIMESDEDQSTAVPQIHADLSLVANMLYPRSYSVSYLQAKIDSTKTPYSFAVGTTATIKVKAEYKKQKNSPNIICYLEGNDPVLKNEYIILGAHLDHVGRQGENFYFPGANDNASGCAAILEIARCLKKAGTKRSVVFIFFTNEESGLHGSKYFVEHSPLPFEKITAMLNFDCVGYGDSIQVGGGKSNMELWSLPRNADKSINDVMTNSTWSGGGSDATPYFEKNIPTLYFVSKYSYAHLHLASDTYETLNYKLFQKITRLGYYTAYKVANGEYVKERVVK
jgi:hypothetical protein